ncbi:MAG: AAA family ATPase [Myxococcales bacterium]|nr:AAA family ATPase [Myxococcales bacterium]
MAAAGPGRAGWAPRGDRPEIYFDPNNKEKNRADEIELRIVMSEMLLRDLGGIALPRGRVIAVQFGAANWDLHPFYFSASICHQSRSRGMSDSEALGSFLPAVVTNRYPTGTETLPSAVAEPCSSALIFADIVGFTPIADRISCTGPEGVEQLNSLLNAYFGRLVDMVASRGGDVVSFSGDGILAHFPVADFADADAGAATAAVDCALAVQRELDRQRPQPEVPLSLRIGVSIGRATALHLRGTGERWFFALGGGPLAKVGTATALAGPGQVVVCGKVAPLLSGSFESEHLREGYVRVQSSHPALALRAIPPRQAFATAPVRRYLPAMIRSRLEAGQGGWLGELRQVTVLFVNLEGLQDAATGLAQTLDTAVHALLEAIEPLDGCLHQLVIDDKGTVMIIAFGLPPHMHEDDAARALHVAPRLRERLRPLGLEANIGIATGRAFCGPVGSDRRREYAIMGNIMNLSARLMQMAKGEVLCDRATRDAAQAEQALEALPVQRIKGVREAVALYRVTRRSNSLPPAPNRSPLVGRSAELAELRGYVDGVIRGRQPPVLVEGEAGMGKSHFVREVVRQAEAVGVKARVAHTSALETTTSYFAMRTVLADLLDLDPAASAEEQARCFLARIGERPELLRLAPLIKGVLPLPLMDTDITSGMEGEALAENTRALLKGIFENCHGDDPFLLVIEDAQWIDAASVDLIKLLQQRFERALIVVTARGDRKNSDPIAAIFEGAEPHKLKLEALGVPDTATLVSAHLDAARLPTAVAERIQEKGGGNPFFSVQYALEMLETGVLLRDRNRVVFDPEMGGDLPDTIPRTLQGLATNRIDRMHPDAQLALKIASVLGQRFDFELLSTVHPLSSDRDALRRLLTRLAKDGVLEILHEQVDRFAFHHQVIQEAAYALLPFAQRRSLHAAVAKELERRQGSIRGPATALIAHHWRRASNYERAADFFEEAGDQGLERGAHRDASALFASALDLVKQALVEIPSLRVASWERRIAEAHLRAGNFDRSRPHLERALSLLGRPLPGDGRILQLATLRALGLQFAHRLRPPPSPPGSSARTYREIAASYEALAQLAYFTNAMQEGLFANVSGLNHAERIGPCSQLARGYGLFGTTCGILGLHGLARKYDQLARDVMSGIPALSDRALVQIYFTLHRASLGEWDLALNLIREGLKWSEQLGDKRRWLDFQSLLGIVLLPAGRPEAAAHERNRFFQEVQHREDPQLLCWALVERAEVACRQGGFDDANHWLQDAHEYVDKCGAADAIWLDGLRAKVLLGSGQLSAARELAAACLIRMQTIPPMNFYALEGYAGAAETLVELGSRPQARRALRVLDRFARSFPIARARACWLRARYLLGTGRRRKAIRLLNEALAHARHCAMPYDEGLLQLELTRTFSKQHPRRRLAWKEARRLLGMAGAIPELAELERML